MRVESQHAERVGAVARGQEDPELDHHLVEAARSTFALVGPLDRVVVVDPPLDFLGRGPVASEDYVRAGHPGLDAVPPGRGGSPWERERRRDTGQREGAGDETPHPQNPSAAPSPRASAPPRSVPSVSVIPCAWPIWVNQSETTFTLWPRRRISSRTSAGMRPSRRRRSEASDGSSRPNMKRGR